jgi:CheY-like chemotaxis protein
MAADRRDGKAEFSHASVLIVDGDPGVRRVLDYILRELDCEILLASDGESALEMVEQQEPDMVLAEVRLPGISGPELAARLRATGHMNTRIVLMSAYPRPPIGAEDHFLYKPIRFERLLDIASAAIASHV